MSHLINSSLRRKTLNYVTKLKRVVKSQKNHWCAEFTKIVQVYYNRMPSVTAQSHTSILHLLFRDFCNKYKYLSSLHEPLTWSLKRLRENVQNVETQNHIICIKTILNNWSRYHLVLPFLTIVISNETSSCKAFYYFMKITILFILHWRQYNTYITDKSSYYREWVVEEKRRAPFWNNLTVLNFHLFCFHILSASSLTCSFHLKLKGEAWLNNINFLLVLSQIFFHVQCNTLS